MTSKRDGEVAFLVTLLKLGLVLLRWFKLANLLSGKEGVGLLVANETSLVVLEVLVGVGDNEACLGAVFKDTDELAIPHTEENGVIGVAVIGQILDLHLVVVEVKVCAFVVGTDDGNLVARLLLDNIELRVVVLIPNLDDTCLLVINGHTSLFGGGSCLGGLVVGVDGGSL